MIASTAAQRLANISWSAYEGDYEPVQRIVAAQGGAWESRADGTQIARTQQMVVGFAQTDPMTMHVQVCFTLFGQYWPMIPDAAAAQKLINKRWKEATKAAQETRHA